MSGRVTIKSIARDLGVSHMTVSRALSGHPHVQKETREAVQLLARELGYVKNAAATTMRGDATKIVGLLLPNILNEFYARFANIMALECEEKSLHLIIHLTNDDIEIEQQSIGRLREIQARAIVMVPAPGNFEKPNPHLDAMKVIQLIRRRKHLPANGTILVDDHNAIRDAVVHLAATGHRKIAYFGADAALSSGRGRLAAFRLGLAIAGLTEDPALIHMDSPSFEMGRTSADTILDMGIATSVVCGGVEISNGALSSLMARDIPPSEAFSFIGYGDPSFYSWVNGGVSTIRIPVESLAYRAVELVVREPSTYVGQSEQAEEFPAKLVVRENRHYD